MNLIEQSINIGSIYQALEKKAVTVGEVLQYLAKAPVTPNTVLAYSATCKHQNPNDHYIGSDRFLTIQPHPDYQMVYAYFTGIVDYSWDKLKGINTAQYALLAKTRRKCNPDLDKQMRIICAMKNIDSPDCKTEDLSLLFQSRHPVIWSFSDTMQKSMKFQQKAIDTDWIDLIGTKYTKEWIEMILARCKYLNGKAPEYWKSVVRSDYSRMMINAIKDKKMSRELSLIRKIKEVFPEVCPELDMYSDLAWKISLLPIPVQAYLLGFHLELGIPHESLLKSALLTLSKVRHEEYLSNLKKRSEDRVDFGPGCDELKPGNTQDVMLNDINTYSPFDRIYYTNGQHIFCFTRVEFNSLLEKKVNPWNKEKIPDHIIGMIQCRQDASKSLQLPSCEPLSDLYEKVSNGSLSLVQTEPESSDKDVFESFVMAMLSSGSRVT